MLSVRTTLCGLAAGALVGCTASSPDPSTIRTVTAETRPRMLRSTFATPIGSDPSAPSSLTGHWMTGSTELVLVPRSSPQGAGIFGAVPRGLDEGVLWLSTRENETWRGMYIHADDLSRRQTVVRYDATRRVLEWQRGEGAWLLLQRAGSVNVPLLQSISIIGHRGLSLGRAELMNSVAAIQNSWLFGSSGVELDLTVPYNEDGRPLPDALRVYHPNEWNSEILGADSAAAAEVTNAPDLETALSATRQAGIPFIYLDPKLRWLVHNDRRSAAVALQRIVAAARDHSSGMEQIIAIGTETSGPGEAADLMTDIRARENWPETVVWALEMTRGTDLQNAYVRLLTDIPGGRPEVASFNLLRVTGGGGGLLRLFVSRIPQAMEDAFAGTLQPVIFWTAQDERQFDGALAALSRMMRYRFREAAIVTAYPHRLAFYLATQPVS
jgi:hypothetical protein